MSRPRCSAALLMTQAWLYGVPRYSSLESRCASMEMSATSPSGNARMIGMLTECSPPMATMNFPSPMAGETAKSTSANMSSGRMKSSQLP